MRILKSTLALFAFASLVTALTPAAQAADKDFNGRWDIQVNTKPGNIHFTTTKAWWLGIADAGTPEMKVDFVGSPQGGPYEMPGANIHNGVLHFAYVSRDGKDRIDYEVKYINGVLQGRMMPPYNFTFTGHRAPAINEHDDGTWIQGKPITLFNGKDLIGWRGVDSVQPEGWSVVNGLLTSTGHADDLITARKFWDFELHAEFRLGQKSNSGIGLRGRYEVQIASDYGRPPNLHGTGALYLHVVPRVNASKPAGEWQTYDIRIVGLEVTTTLNGQKLYEKGVASTPTGICSDPFEGRPGPIQLQGSHGPVEFRNIVLVPLTQRKGKSTNANGE